MLYRLADAASEATTRWGAGLALTFHEATRDGLTEHVAVVRVYDLVSPEVAPSSWLYAVSSIHIVVNHERLLQSVPWIPDGGRIRILLPMYAPDLVFL